MMTVAELIKQIRRMTPKPDSVLLSRREWLELRSDFNENYATFPAENLERIEPGTIMGIPIKVKP